MLRVNKAAFVAGFIFFLAVHYFLVRGQFVVLSCAGIMVLSGSVAWNVIRGSRDNEELSLVAGVAVAELFLFIYYGFITNGFDDGYGVGINVTLGVLQYILITASGLLMFGLISYVNALLAKDKL